MAFKVVANRIAESISLKEVRLQFSYQLLFSDSDELYFQIGTNQFVYIFQYGMVSFFNMTDAEIDVITQSIAPYCYEYTNDFVSDEIELLIQPNTLDVTFDKIILPELNSEMIRLVMLNTTQSVALNWYSQLTEELLKDTTTHTIYLEEKGKLNISGAKLKRYIGRILNIKNKISVNLYIFDSPEITSEQEHLNKLNLGLKWSFDLKDRYQVINQQLEIIKENLDLFKDIMHHRESSKLEWIIIILILVEVVDLFILKLIN